MILEPNELVELYEGVVKSFGHPDPLGYMTRALLISEGDPEYIDIDGKQGFQPVLPELALELVGAQEVQSLQSNVVATLSMDRLFYNRYRSVDNMIIAFHFGEDALNDVPTNEYMSFIDDVNETRNDTLQLMYPPLATVDDVIKLLDPRQVDIRLSNGQKGFFEFLLTGS